MSYIIWTVILVLGAGAIYWLVDWHDKFPDGE